MTRATVVATLVAAFGSAKAGAQERVRGTVIYESYAFDGTYPIEDMAQMTIPIAVESPLGSRASFVLSTGYVSVQLDSRDPALATQRVHGPLDTEMRLDLSVVPDRLVTFLAATVPTGRQTVTEDQLSLLIALANDAVGFSALSLGSGGSVGGGLSTAVPLGRFALGAAATAVYAFAYEPVLAQRVSLRPGAEVRVRLGLEGALSNRTYVRVASSIAARQKDQLGGEPTHGLGRRAIGYVTLEQGLGSYLLALYASDVYRGSPQLEPTALGTAILPKGNLMILGTTLTVPLGTSSFLVPSLEYRVASAAADVDDPNLHRQGSSLRAGAEFRQRLSPDLSFVVRGQAALGEIRQSASFDAFKGYRLAASVEVSP